jgi:regulator of protease activity HflC (stomatin/prohibitin superfamily)
MAYLLYLVAAAVLVLLLYKARIDKVVVREYEAGLLYRSGRFHRRLEPGGYYIWRLRSDVHTVDMRKTSVTVPGQEVLSADNVGLKISTVVAYEVVDPERAVHRVQDFRGELYVAVQLALRSAIADANIDEVLNQRLEIGQRLLSQVALAAEPIGLRVHSVEVKDVMFPGDLKKTFAEVVKAQKQGQAALEKARGETAALRNLANAARMIEKSPALLHLRTLHTLAGQSGVTVVLGTPPDLSGTASGQPRPIKPEETEGDSLPT